MVRRDLAGRVSQERHCRKEKALTQGYVKNCVDPIRSLGFAKPILVIVCLEGTRSIKIAILVLAVNCRWTVDKQKLKFRAKHYCFEYNRGET